MKASLILAFSVAASLVLKADVMKWQVNDSSLATSCNGARLMYSDDANRSQNVTVLSETDLVNGVGDIVQIDMGSIPSANAKYYYVEAGNYNGDVFTASKVMGAYSYSDLVSAGLISTGAMNPPSTSMFGQSGVTINNQQASYGAVPEPSSAMLILLGLAVAGLKRRRA